MSFMHHADLTERLLHEVDVTYDAIEIIKKNEHGDDISVSDHASGTDGRLRDSYPHFMNLMGSLMLEPAMKAGFRLPVSRFQLGDVSQYAKHFEKQADTGYIVKVKNLKMTVPQVEAAQDAGREAYKAGVDFTAAFWGGDANPFAKVWADSAKGAIDTQQEIFDASRTLKEGKYDLSEFAAEMASWSKGVETWLDLIYAQPTGSKAL